MSRQTAEDLKDAKRCVDLYLKKVPYSLSLFFNAVDVMLCYYVLCVNSSYVSISKSYPMIPGQAKR